MFEPEGVFFFHFEYLAYIYFKVPEGVRQLPPSPWLGVESDKPRDLPIAQPGQHVVHPEDIEDVIRNLTSDPYYCANEHLENLIEWLPYNNGLLAMMRSK